MNPKKLIDSETQETKLFYCGKCGKYFRDKDMAEKCCICIDCGKEIDHNFSNTECTDCSYKRRQKRENNRLAKVEEITDISNIECFYVSDYFFFLDAGDVEDYLHDLDPEDRPEWIFSCKRIEFNLDLADILADHACNNHHENYEFNDLDEIINYFDKWCKKQPCSYDPIMTKKISSKLFLEEI